MNRAQVDKLAELAELRPIAIALGRYLQRCCDIDPNPSGTHAPAKPAREGGGESDDASDETLALIPDQRYTIKQVWKLTGKTETTLRKMTSEGKLPFLKGADNRVSILGSDVAKLMARQVTEPTGAEAPPVEA